MSQEFSEIKTNILVKPDIIIVRMQLHYYKFDTIIIKHINVFNKVRNIITNGITVTKQLDME